MDIETQLTQLEKEAQELKKTQQTLDAENARLRSLLAGQHAPLTRKMRWDAEDKTSAPTVWLPRRPRLESMTAEELAIGKMVFNARGVDAPDTLEDALRSKIATRTLTTGGPGTGAELVEATMWDQLFEDVHAATMVAPAFRPYIEMPGGSEELPEMADPIWYKPSGEGVAVTATDPTTAKRTLTAYTLKAQVDIVDELSEDAVVNMLPEIRAKLVRTAAETIDELIVNADASTGKTNINYYDAAGADIPTSSRFLIGFDGLVHYCLNEVTGQTTSITTLGASSFSSLIAKLGKYGDNPDHLLFIVDRAVKNKAIDIDDFRTVDKLGDAATLIRGQIAKVFGVAVVLGSGMQRSNSTGQVDQTGGNNTKGRIVLVNRDMWKIGMRRQIRVATQRDESKTLTSIVGSMRIALQTFGDRASADYCHTALGYNVTV